MVNYNVSERGRGRHKALRISFGKKSKSWQIQGILSTRPYEKYAIFNIEIYVLLDISENKRIVPIFSLNVDFRVNVPII